MLEPGTNEQSDDFLCEINVTPLVDVMLVLLVIFIVTASAVTTAVHVNLPQTEQVSQPDAIQPIVVVVDRNGDYLLHQQVISLDHLKHRLASLHAQHPDKVVQLQADKDVSYGHVGQLMAALQAAGINKITVLSSR